VTTGIGLGARRLATAARAFFGFAFPTHCTRRWLDGLQQSDSTFIIRQAEVFPPIGEFNVYFADLSAQTHEIETGTKTRLFDQAKRGTAAALLESGLHAPNLAHIAC
jgi:hypothetical protein